MIPPLILRIAAGIILLLVVGGVYLHHRRRRRVAARLGDPSLLRQLLGEDLSATPRLRFALVVLGAMLLAAALLDPMLTGDREGSRGPVVLILDASGSMLVDDVGPRRLDLQRAIAEDFVALIPELPVGVVAFAGRAFSLTPPTRDRDAVGMYLSALDPTIVTQSGSALGAAIRQGVSLLAAGGAAERGGTIILFGDGDETDDPAATRAAADLAGGNGIAVHVVGVGTPQGGPVPALDLTTGTASGFLREPGGDIRMSVLGEDLLRDIAARSAGGMYFAAAEEGAAERLAGVVGRTDAPMASTAWSVPVFAWLALAAFLLLLIEPLGRRRRDK